MKKLDSYLDPAIPVMTMDILSRVLSCADNPGALGAFLTEEIRELTGARCVLLIRWSDQSIENHHQIIDLNPERRRMWAESLVANEIYEFFYTNPVSQIWNCEDNSPVARLLRQEGFDLSLAIPFDLGEVHVGALLALGLPDTEHQQCVIDLLETLSPIVALVLRNTFLYEKQEQVIEERTAELFNINEELKAQLVARKIAQDALAESEENYHHLFSEMIEGFALHEIICNDSGIPVDYRFLNINPAFERMTGIYSHDAVGKTVLEILPGTESFWIERYGKVALTREAIKFEQFANELGKHYLVIAYSPKPHQFAVIIEDITEEKLKDEKIRETNAYLDNLITIANVPIIIWDPSFRITRINHACEELIGRTAEHVIGTFFATLIPPAQVENSMQLLKTTLEGVRWETVNIDILHRDGSIRTVLWSSATLFTPDGSTPVATIAQGRDITGELRLEREKDVALIQIQKNLAQLAILNDEIRNPLTIIMTYADMLEDPRVIDQITDQVQRIDEIVNHLDQRWVESEKVLTAIRKHYHLSVSSLEEHKTLEQKDQKIVPGAIISSTDNQNQILIEELRAELYTILDNIDASIYVTDMDTHDLLYLNRQGRRLFGDIIGQKCYQTIQKDQGGPCPFCTNYLLIDQSGPTGVYQWEFQNTRNGRWYDCRDRAVRWTDGRMVRLEIATDITKIKKEEEILRKTLEELRSLDTLTEEREEVN